MTDTIKVVRVFLASPGDMHDERKLVRECVDEVNNTVGIRIGYQVNLMGWEDTFPQMGRPQESINKELDTSDLVIGMMYKKWGTKPSKEGEYTSGFEEEYYRSLKRHKKTGKPDICLYFKKISNVFFQDPGEELKKVQKFKNDLIESKEVLFTEFEDDKELQGKIRSRISDFLFSLREKEKASTNENKSRYKQENRENDEKDLEGANKSLAFSEESKGFLQKIMNKTVGSGGESDCKALDVARLRLISATIHTINNDPMVLGVHDSNVIYYDKEVIKARKEILSLINSGLHYMSTENAPLWFWYKKHCKRVRNTDVFKIRSISYRNNNIAKSAIKALKMMGDKDLNISKKVDRSFILRKWLSKDSSIEVKIEGLDYLAKLGIKRDIEVIRSLNDESSVRLNEASLEAILSILIKYDRKEVLKTIFSNMGTRVSQRIIEEMSSTEIKASEKDLKESLFSHVSEDVRLFALKRIGMKLSRSELENLTKDESNRVRYEAICHIEDAYGKIGLSNAEKILKDVSIGKSTALTGKNNGEELFKVYKFNWYLNENEENLLQLIKDDYLLDGDAYLALNIKYYSKYKKKLKKDIRDNFKQLINNSVSFINKEDASGKILETWVGLKAFLIRKLLRKSLDLLCYKNESTDLRIIREFMAKDIPGGSILELGYISNHGDWSDIENVINMEQEYLSLEESRAYFGDVVDHDWTKAKGKAIYKLGGDKINELLDLEMSDVLKHELIKQIPISAFDNINIDTLFNLLRNERLDVRREVCLKMIRAFTKMQLRKIFEEYLKNEKYFFYNVIYWFDFGLSLTNKEINNYFKYN